MATWRWWWSILFCPSSSMIFSHTDDCRNRPRLYLRTDGKRYSKSWANPNYGSSIIPTRKRESNFSPLMKLKHRQNAGGTPPSLTPPAKWISCRFTDKAFPSWMPLSQRNIKFGRTNSEAGGLSLPGQMLPFQTRRSTLNTLESAE